MDTSGFLISQVSVYWNNLCEAVKEHERKGRRQRRTVLYHVDLLPEHQREVVEFLGSSIA